MVQGRMQGKYGTRKNMKQKDEFYLRQQGSVSFKLEETSVHLALYQPTMDGQLERCLLMMDVQLVNVSSNDGCRAQKVSASWTRHHVWIVHAALSMQLSLNTGRASLWLLYGFSFLSPLRNFIHNGGNVGRKLCLTFLQKELWIVPLLFFKGIVN